MALRLEVLLLFCKESTVTGQGCVITRWGKLPKHTSTEAAAKVEAALAAAELPSCLRLSGARTVALLCSPCPTIQRYGGTWYHAQVLEFSDVTTRLGAWPCEVNLEAFFAQRRLDEEEERGWPQLFFGMDPTACDNSHLL